MLSPANRVHILWSESNIKLNYLRAFPSQDAGSIGNQLKHAGLISHNVLIKRF
jgi:hypothetical protein